jgi:tetratricopeptide (TPR) repeat protein
LDLALAPLVAWIRSYPLPELDEPWLIELSRLLPEVLARHPNLQPPEAIKESWQRLRLFESLARAILSESQRLILFLDDLQWCDLETLDWLLYLFHPQAIEAEIYKNSRILLIGSLCLEQLDEKSPLHALLRELRRSSQLTETHLGPLDKAATQLLATRLSGEQFSPKILDSLYRETEGNPLFIVELVRGGFVRQLDDQSFSKLNILPPKVEAAIQSRLDQLSEGARELAKIAAVIGRQPALEILAKIYGGDEGQLILNLDELWRRHILREQDEMVYEFTNGKIRDIAYASITTARKRLLHKQIAQSLEELHATDLEKVLGQLAFHHEKADQIDRAVPCYLQAAEAARKVYANREAIEYYQKCLVLIERLPSNKARQEMTVNVYECLGDTQMVAGQFSEAEAAYLAGMQSLAEIDRLWQARLYRKNGNALKQQSRFIEAFQGYDQAEALLDGLPQEDNQEWMNEWIQVRLDRMGSHYWVHQSDKMDRLAEEVQPVLEKYGTSTQMIIFFRELALALLSRDRHIPSDQVCDFYRRSLEAARNAGNQVEVAVSWFGLGFMHLWRRNLGEAQSCLFGALEVAVRTRNIAVQLQCMIYLSVLYRILEHVDQAEDYALRSLPIAEGLKMLHYVGSAQANLAWIAWRKGDLASAQAHGLAALESFQRFPSPYPFQWLARWPLIAVSMSLKHTADAVAHARSLLDPNQQRLPDELSMSVLEAIRAWESGKIQDASTKIQYALKQAQRLGYI